jgi:hypothetical protein
MKSGKETSDDVLDSALGDSSVMMMPMLGL